MTPPLTSIVLPVPPGGGGIAPSFKFPYRYTETSLACELALRLAGKPADGASPFVPPTSSGAPQGVVWVDAGSELLPHLDSVKVRITDGMVTVSSTSNAIRRAARHLS